MQNENVNGCFTSKLPEKKHQTSDEIARLFVVFVWHARLTEYFFECDHRVGSSLETNQ